MDLKRYRPTTKGKSIQMRKYQENLTQLYGPQKARKMPWSFTLSFLPPERFCAWSRNFRVRRLLHVPGLVPSSSVNFSLRYYSPFVLLIALHVSTIAVIL